ncbi:MAG: hypothetical protein JKY52_03210 [Flavobacteriales bacterium]|nr:hypothetical protein [Flavobacteriales bacterium]
MALVLMGSTAILDLGTNTFNLLIVKNYGEDYQTIHKTKIPAKLGAGGFAKKTITPEAFERGILAIKAHQMIIQQYHADRIFAFATSAMRDASNGAEFVQEVAKQTGIEINIISGDREAELIHKGVCRALEIGDQPELIMDIGGGSTEFIIANNKKVLWKHSYDLGVARLLELLKPTDPLTPAGATEFENFLEKELTSLFHAVADHGISGLIGSAGSFDSLAEMIEMSAEVPMKLSGVTEYTFSLQDLKELNTKLCNSTYDERAEMRGLVPYRVETIPLASVFIDFMIVKLALNKVRLSTYSLREGVISELPSD